MTASIAIAALGSAFAFLAKSVSEMSWRARVVTLVVLLAVVFGPIVLAGVLKLMRQDLGPIIEGCGWAVNKSMRLTRRLRRQFTLRLPYPGEADGTPGKRFLAGLLTLLVAAALVVCVVFGVREGCRGEVEEVEKVEEVEEVKEVEKAGEVKEAEAPETTEAPEAAAAEVAAE